MRSSVDSRHCWKVQRPIFMCLKTKTLQTKRCKMMKEHYHYSLARLVKIHQDMIRL